MRDVIPYIFWPWFGISCVILLRRRITGGSWRAMGPQEAPAPIEFPPPPPETVPDPPPMPAADTSQDAREPDPDAAPPTPAKPAASPVAVMAPADPDRPRARSLAEAVEGIAMPCDLAPLMGTGPLDPREVTFFTHGHAAGDVGSALSDELERLGFVITPLDERSIRAERAPDVVEARLVSTELTSPDVMRERHPSAPADALVVELKLS